MTPLPAPTLPQPPSALALAKATGLAFAVSLLVLVGAVLPAEYGVDLTGFGRAAGFTKLHDARAPPAPEADPGRLLYEARAAWTLREVPLGVVEGAHRGLSEQTVEVPVNLTNVTAVVARLEWVDAPAPGSPGGTAPPEARPDTFVLRVRPPAPDRRVVTSPATANGPDGAGNVTVTFPWRADALPSEANGTLAFPRLPEDGSARGTWRFDVWLQAIGGAPADEGNAWRLNLTAHVFALEARVDDAPMDRVALTLAPGQGIEYKFRMAAGARMQYRWASDQPLFSDLHGDRPGTRDEASYKAGTFTADEGAFEAAFDGRHGWYWKNEGSQPARLTLATRGAYQILGPV